MTEEEKRSEMAKTLSLDFISSDDSDEEGFITRSLNWRDEKIGDFFSLLDSRWEKSLSSNQRRQLQPRKAGAASLRSSTNVPAELKKFVV